MSRATRIALGGLDLVPDLSGALFVPEYETLIVADLHLEKGSSLARRGVHLPPYDTRETLAHLASVVETVSPLRLLFLGDSFHDGKSRERIDAADLRRLRDLAAAQETVWISGNHDPAPPGDLGGLIADEVVLGPIALRHEPRPLAAGEFEIAGHLHPGATIVQRGLAIRRRCFVANSRRLVMPAFGAYTGALGVSAAPFAELFGGGGYSVWMLGGRAIHKFPAVRVR